jgi:hypothetical protein
MFTTVPVGTYRYLFGNNDQKKITLDPDPQLNSLSTPDPYR